MSLNNFISILLSGFVVKLTSNYSSDLIEKTVLVLKRNLRILFVLFLLLK